MEARYLKQRQQRGYVSLYENEPHLKWNATPGFYERQLQRRHNNVLFPAQKRTVSREDLYIACRLDAEERVAFLEQWKQILEKFIQGTDILPFPEAIDYLHQIYELLEKAVSIAGESAAKMEDIHRMYQTVLSQLYEAIKDNPEMTNALKSSVHARWSGSEKVVLNPTITQLLRVGDAADMIPALLCEDVETICSTLEILNAANLEAVRNTVVSIIAGSPEAREVLRRQPQKLEALGMHPL